MTYEEEIKQYMAVHTWADYETAEYSANYCHANNIPFCEKCSDWHREGTLHSMVYGN